MKISKFLAVLVCGAIVAASAISCHKSSDDDDSEYMDGTLAFELASFLEAGSSVELTPTGVTYGSDKKIPGFYWYTSENSTKDTTRYEGDPASVTGKFLLEVDEDFTGTLTVTCSAYAEGYYIRSQASSVVIVNQETSLNIPGQTDEDPVFTDGRDGNSYRYVSLGGLDWFARNLAYTGGYAPFGAEVLRNIFGTFYTWDEARTACPEGWRLPSAADWKSLAEALGAAPADVHSTFEGISGKMMTEAYFNDNELWEFTATVKITGDSGFAALPFGYANVDGSMYKFSDFYSYAVFWTDEELNEEQAYYRYMYYSSPDVRVATGYKNYFAAPVRCVRDSSI
mgnify:CR=1 FL=1